MPPPLFSSDEPGQKTLVLCPIGLGNFIMATPGLELLSKTLGRENLHLLALRQGIREMAEASGWFKRVHYWDPDKESIGKGLSVLAGLRRECFDRSISLFPSGYWKFCLFHALAGARVKIGFKYYYTRLPALVQDISFLMDTKAHDTEQNLGLIQTCLGLPLTPPEHLSFPVRRRPLELDELPKMPFFVCHPGSSPTRGMMGKRLPVEKFADIIGRICRRFKLKCLLVGGPEEETLRRHIVSRCDDEAMDAGPMNLGELASALASAKFFLGNDSGVMHMAVALGKKCVAFFGPSDEVRTGPYYLSEEDRQRDTSYSRGHLILRDEHDKPFLTKKLRQLGNPRLIYDDTRGLKEMNMDAAWEKIAPFLDSVLHPED